MQISGVNAPRAQSLQQPSDPKLWKTAQDFQEVFMTQWVKSMRESEMKGDLLDEAPGSDTYNEMLSEAIGKQMASDRSLGLHETIYRQLGGKFDGAAAMTRKVE